MYDLQRYTWNLKEKVSVLYSASFSVHRVQFKLNIMRTKEFTAEYKRILIRLHTHIPVLDEHTKV